MNHSIKICIATTLLAHSVSAQPNESADAARDRGNAALKAGRIHEACEAFEASDKLAANLDTELALASCYEQDAKPIAAARLYRSTADKDTNSARRQTSIAKAAKLEAKAPKLRFAINPVPPHLVIKVDGVEVPVGGDVLVDVGPHEVVATAPGFAGHASAPVDRDRAIVDVILRMEPVEEPAEKKPAPAPAADAAEAKPMTGMTAKPAAEPAATATDHRMRNGIIVGASGVAVLAGAAVLFGLSSSKFDDEHALCPASRCANDADLAQANSLLSDAHWERRFAIGMGIGSGVLLAVSGYLLLAPHKEESRVSFHVQPGGAGIAYTAHF